MRGNEKNELKPWQVKEWCIPQADAEFVAKMEDVREVYQRPYDPLNPVACIDETNKQLVQETRIPCEPGQPGQSQILCKLHIGANRAIFIPGGSRAIRLSP